MPDRWIGIDESGKGDFFGPLVIAAVYVTIDDLEALDGIKDSKRLKDAACLELDEMIRARCPHSVVSIGNSKYNELYKEVLNLNTLLAWGHARAVENLLEQVECEDVYAERFVDSKGLAHHLAKKGKHIVPHNRVSPDISTSVAAASIVARAEFIRKLTLLGEKAGLNLPKGANWNVVNTAVELVKKSGKEILKDVAKVHFKTVADVLKKARSA